MANCLYLFIGFLAFSFVLADSILYLSPSGSDSTNCTSTSPCSSLLRASSLATTNDTILLSTGDYVISESISFNISVKIFGDPAGVSLVCANSSIHAITFLHAPSSSVSGLTMYNCKTAITILNSPYSTISDTNVYNGGAGIYVGFSDDVSITNCNVAGMRGDVFAAITVISGYRFLLVDCRIYNNTNLYDDGGFPGGGLRFFAALRAKLLRCVFSRNTALRGAAIMTGEGFEKWEMEDCVFIENVATLNGGAVYATTNSTISVRSSQFIGNSAFQGGGALAAGESTTITLFNSTFVGNSAQNGGAYDTGAYAQVRIQNCVFDGNSAQLRGGAIYSRTSHIHVNASVFRNNNAEDGGAAYLLDTDAEIHGFEARNNSAQRFGGGLFVESSELDVSPFDTDSLTCNFAENIAAEGGAIHMRSSTATISNCVLALNSANYSGAIYSFDSTVLFDNSIMNNNSATNEGGAIGVYASTINIQNTTVVFNSAQRGGGSYLSSGFVTIQNSDFTNNVATNEYGAAIEMTHEMEMSLRVIQTRMTNSLAPYQFCCIQARSTKQYVLTSEMSSLICEYPACNSSQCATSPADSCLCTTPTLPCECDTDWLGPYCAVYNSCKIPDFCGPSNSAICSESNYTFTCSCVEGYSKDSYGKCADADECMAGEHNCTIHSTCVNEQGGFSCKCDKGYTLHNNLCTDIDECESAPCDPLQKCVNTIGSYRCDMCSAGFEFSGSECSDIDECLVENGGCDYHTQCTNTIGSNECGECPIGFSGNGRQGCVALCGDGECDAQLGENCVSCHFDCPKELCQMCGDGKCSGNETCYICSEDCGTCKVQRECLDPLCSGHGICRSGVCECYSNWNGPSCEAGNSAINVTIIDKPIMIIHPSSSFTFSLAITEIRELDRNGNLIISANVTNLNFTTNHYEFSTFELWTLTASLESLASLTINIWSFKNTTSLIFANSSNTFLANSVKFSLQVVNWPFRNIQHSLQIMVNTPKRGVSDVCENSSRSSVDANGNLKWITVGLENNMTLYGQFSEIAVIDGLIRKINFTQEEYLIAANIPHFWTSAEIDPNFSVLFMDPTTPRAGPCVPRTQKTHSQLSTLIVAIVVPSVVVILVAVLAWTVVWPRIALRMRLRKEKRALEEQMQQEGYYPGAYRPRQI